MAGTINASEGMEIKYNLADAPGAYNTAMYISLRYIWEKVLLN